MSKNQLILAVAVLLLYGGGRQLEANASSSEYRIISLQGKAGIQPRGASTVSPAKKNMALKSGDRLVTGKKGSIQLASKDGTVMQLSENSDFKINQATENKSSFSLKLGRLLARFSPMEKRRAYPRYEIHSPIMVGAVRGTELVMDVANNGETQAGVIEGKVSFLPREDISDLEASEDMESHENLMEDESHPDMPPEEDVSMESIESPIAEESDMDPSVPAPAQTDEIVVEANQGIVAKPEEPLVKTLEIPPLLVDSLTAIPHLRDTVPNLVEQWKTISTEESLQLREKSLKNSIKWTPPEKLEIPNPFK